MIVPAEHEIINTETERTIRRAGGRILTGRRNSMTFRPLSELTLMSNSMFAAVMREPARVNRAENRIRP